MLKTILVSSIFLFLSGASNTNLPEALNEESPAIINKIETNSSISKSLKCNEQGSGDLLEYYAVLQFCYGECFGLWCCEIVRNPNPDE